MRTLLTAAALALTALPAAAQEVLPAHAIPKDAVVIFASQRANELDPWGLKADALYVANWKGEVTRITYSKFAHNHFSASPDRRYVLANRYSTGDNNKDGKYFPYDDKKEMWLIDTVTGQERRIAPEYDGGWGGVAWGPDSKTVYFSGPSPTDKTVFDVKKVNIETGKVEIVTSRLNQLLGEPEGETRKSVTDIDVSDDGQWLIINFRTASMMAEGITGGEPKARIGAMKLDGSQAHVVSDGGPLPNGRRGVWPVGDFDPDAGPGNKIVWARITTSAWVTPDLSTWDLWVSNLDGSDAHNISGQDETSAEVIPNWGRADMIAFSRAEIGDGRRKPYVVNLKTGKRTQMDVEGRHAQFIPGYPDQP